MPYVAKPVKSYCETGYSMVAYGYLKTRPGVSFRADYADGMIEAAERRQSHRRAAASRHSYYSGPLPYQVVKAWDEKHIGPWSSNALSEYGATQCDPSFRHNDIDRNLNKARERFVENCRARVEVGEFLGEIGKSAESIHSLLKPATELFGAMLGVRRGDVKPLYQLLSKTNPITGAKRWRRTDRWQKRREFMDRLRNERSVVKNSDAHVANAWLELQYGLGPAIETIWDVSKTLEAGLPYGRVIGRSRTSLDLTKNRTGLTGWQFNGHMVVKHHVQADVLLTAPAVGALEQFGALNPAALAWELTPFSLVVDWFVNIGSWLRQFSDLAGLELKNSFYSCKREAIVDCQMDEGAPWGVTTHRTVRAISLERTVGFPPVVLVRERGLQSFKRAANAIALVTSIGHSVLNSTPARRWT